MVTLRKAGRDVMNVIKIGQNTPRTQENRRVTLLGQGIKTNVVQSVNDKMTAITLVENIFITLP